MKKFLPLIMLILITACSKDEPISQQYNFSNLSQQFENAQERVNSSINNIYSYMFKIQTRTQSSSIRGSEFINCILNLSQEQIDSLTAIYCTDKRVEIAKSYREIQEARLISLSSDEEFAKFNWFMDEYSAAGGHNKRIVEQYINDVSPIIQQAMIIGAVAIDSMMEGTTRANINWDCIYRAIRSCGSTIVYDSLDQLTLTAMDVLAPEMSVPDIFFALGIEATEINQVLVAYSNCIANRWE